MNDEGLSQVDLPLWGSLNPSLDSGTAVYKRFHVWRRNVDTNVDTSSDTRDSAVSENSMWRTRTAPVPHNITFCAISSHP